MGSCHKRITKNGSLPKRVALAISLVVVLYSGLWLVLAYFLHDYARKELQLLSEQGQHLECENLRKNGYPLRIGLTCDSLRWQDETNEYALTTGKIIAGAPLYAPSWQSVKLNAPAYFDLADLGQMEAIWHHMVLTTNFADETLRDLVVNIENLNVTLTRHQISETALSTEAAFLHLQIKQMQEQVKLILSFEALRLPEKSGFLPTMTGEITLQLNPLSTLPVASNLSDAPLYGLLRGRSGRLESLHLQFSSGGGLSLEGEFHISPVGTLSGQFTAHLLETGALLRTAQTNLPIQASNLDSLFFALNAMPKDRQGNPLLTINIDQGWVRMGFISLGDLPSF